MELLVVLGLLLFLVLAGGMEKRANDKNLEKIPIRVNINGIRGKSTITRLVTSVLAEAGYKTMGKVTGTSPRLILAYDDFKEVQLTRSALGPTIMEQVSVVDEAAKNGCQALACECMAVDPSLQKINQELMVQAQVGVIVNVLEDHMDVMGPTLDEVALAFSSTIPYKGRVVLSCQDQAYLDYFKKVAESRSTEVFISDEEEIPPGYLKTFDYLVFPNNVAIVLAVAKALGIDKETALRGMVKARPDPGALKIMRLRKDNREGLLVNAFAANEPSSTLEILRTLKGYGYLDGWQEKPLIVFNGREDRPDRTSQFAEDCLPYLGDPIDLLTMGESISPMRKALREGRLNNVDEYIDMENKKSSQVLEAILDHMDSRLVFLIGNIHGQAEGLLAGIEDMNQELGQDKPYSPQN